MTAGHRPAHAQPVPGITEGPAVTSAPGVTRAWREMPGAATGRAVGSLGGMTADSYAAAVGLVERSAAAFVSGISGDPDDDGLFGPASVTWRVSGDLARPVS